MTVAALMSRVWRGLGRWRKVGVRPTMLSVEPTNRCNLNCPFCLVGLQNRRESTAHSEMRRPFGHMAPSLFRKIVSDACAFGITDMQLHFQGEPLLHKELPAIVRLAHTAGLRTHVFTNGTLLDEVYATALVEAGIDSIKFSVDGASEATYRTNRVGGDFGTVLRNMTVAADVVRRSNRNVRLTWQFIALRNNEHEIDAARAMAARIGVAFAIKMYAPSVPDLVPVDRRLRRGLLAKPCQDIHRAMFVFWNGDVVVCCYDQEGENVIGNLERHSLVEIWKSPEARLLRRRIDLAAKRPDGEPQMCRACLKWSHHPWQTSDGLTKWEAGEESGGKAGEAEET